MPSVQSLIGFVIVERVGRRRGHQGTLRCAIRVLEIHPHSFPLSTTNTTITTTNTTIATTILAGDDYYPALLCWVFVTFYFGKYLVGGRIPRGLSGVILGLSVACISPETAWGGMQRGRSSGTKGHAHAREREREGDRGRERFGAKLDRGGRHLLA